MKRLDVHVDRFRHEPQINRAAGLYNVGRHRIVAVHVNAVMRRVLCDQRQRQNNRHVIRRLERKRPAAAQLPEIRVSGSLHRLLHIARTAVVGRDRQIPIAELVI